MSSHTHHEIIRAQQREIAARVTHAHHVSDLQCSADRVGRSANFRLIRAVAAIGACAAIGTTLATGSAPASAHPSQQRTHISSSQFSKEIRAFELKGYVQASCTINGTEMRNPSTGQVVTVSL